jgi:nitroreductase
MDSAVDGGIVRAAIALASRAPSTHNTQPWICRLGATSIHLYADPTRWLPATDPDQRDLMLSCGAMLHHLEVALASLGVDVTVHRLPNPADPNHLAALELRRGRLADSAIEDAATLLRRRTDRRPFGNYPLPQQHLDRLIRCASDRGAVLREIDADAGGEALHALLRDAAEIQEESPDYQYELALWSGRTISDDGIPQANLLGQTGRAWNGSRNFPLGQIDIPIGAAPDQATFLVLGTASDDQLSQLRAGEALSAVLLRATAMGLASCPLTQPLEVRSTRLRLRDEILGGTASPQVVLRLGWPQSGLPLPVTPRRAVDDVLEAMPGARMHSERTTREPSAVASPHRPLDFWLKLVDTLINLHFQAMLEEHGIGRRQWEMMRMLSRRAATQEDLDTALAPFLPANEPSSSTAELAELRDSGWLTELDGVYQLTERGLVVHQRLDDVFAQKNSELAEGVPPGEYALVVSVLERIAANLGWRDPAEGS